MKTAGLLLGLFCACLGHLQAQVKLKVSFDQAQFLPGEDLNAVVRIENFSGQTLRLGEDEGWLKFMVEARDRSIVVKNGEAPVREMIDLESSKAMIKTVNLGPYFNLKGRGEFSVTATAVIKGWDKQIVSEPARFDIINAVELWSGVIGVPKSVGETNGAPVVRKYTLLQANHLPQLTLYFQLTDETGKLIKVTRIGRMLSLLPDAQIDRESKLHVLHKIDAHLASYLVFNPEGEMIARQTYEFTTVPHLTFDANGKLVVSGGVRRISRDDIPEPKVAQGGIPNAAK